MIDQKAICGVDRCLEMMMTDVEIEEAVFGPAEADNLAMISAPFHPAAE